MVRSHGWAETEDLALEATGRLYRMLRDADGDYDGREYLGVIDGYHHVPDELGPQLDRLRAEWDDGLKAQDLVAERWQEYRASRS